MRTIIKLSAVTGLYALFAHLALTFFAANGVVSVVWPPSGLALAALLLGGKRYAWATLLGAFIANTITGLPLVAFAIGAGNTLEALIAHNLLTRNGKFNLDMTALPDYLRLMVFGAGLGSIVAAVIGSAALLVSGVLPANAYVMNMIHWWMGDALGILLLTPLILVWRKPPADWLKPKNIIRIALPLGLSLLVGQIVFLNWFHESIGMLARGYWMFLLVTFIAIYLGTHGTVIAIVIIALQALLGATQKVGYFADDITKTELTSFWLFTVILGIIGMAQATYLAERKQVENALFKEKQRYQLLLRTATDGIHILDEQGQLLDASESFYQMLDYPIGTRLNVKDWDAQWSAEQLLENIQQIFIQPAVFITRHRRSDQQIIDVEISARGIEIEGQTLLFASSRDITERLRFESKLQESEIRFRTVANAAPALIWMSGTDKLCDWFNQIWLDFTGRSLEQEMGNGWAEGVHPNDLQRCLAVYINSFDARRPFQMEYRLKHHSGEYRWLLDSGVPRRDEQGVFLGYIGSCIDITDRKRAEADLQQFAEISAHHLQEPVRRMLNFAQQINRQLSATGINADTALSLHYLEQSAVRQRALIGDIQLYLAAGEPRGPVEAVDLAEVVDKVASAYARQISELKTSITCAELPPIQIDKLRLTDIIKILLDNALLYSREDSPLTINISGECKAGRVYCCFADNGKGVPPDYRQRVFRVFERLAANNNPNSTGIGLAIVKHIVESCNGSVSLQETPGGGATVCFDLPQYRPVAES